jgi:hypothetical protein
MKHIKQVHYPNIEIDDSEKDVIIIWMVDPNGKDSQVVQLEIDNIPTLIDHLKNKIRK